MHNDRRGRAGYQVRRGGLEPCNDTSVAARLQLAFAGRKLARYSSLGGGTGPPSLAMARVTNGCDRSQSATASTSLRGVSHAKRMKAGTTPFSAAKVMMSW